MREDLKDLPQEKLATLEQTMDMLENAQENQLTVHEPGQKEEKPPDNEQIFPDWYDGKKIDEIIFGDHLAELHPMRCVQGILYDTGGVVDDQKLKKEIYDLISPFVKSNMAKNVSRLLDAVKISAYCEDLPLQTDRLHVSNGTLFLDGHFSKEKQFCRNRLPVAYDPNAPCPETWLRFLSELLYEDDIPTLQEFMGYALIPTNKAQKMMLITGNGGEGKSRIGRVLRAILGDNMNTSSIQKLATNRFARADQEGILLMLDDDMKMEALTETNILKAIVTMEDKIDLERKGRQSTQGCLYVRIIGLGNGSLSSLYDRSEGFYRRQVSLVVKDKDENRVDDPELGDKMISEAEGIFLWCVEGLKRLIENGYAFTISENTRLRMDEAKRDDNNILDFIESSGYIMFEEGTMATSKELYSVYKVWCDDNAEKPVGDCDFSRFFKNNAEKMNLKYDKNIPTKNGKNARGYHGVHVLSASNDYRQRGDALGTLGT